MLGESLRTFRKRQKRSLHEIATACNLSYRTVWKLEHGAGTMPCLHSVLGLLELELTGRNLPPGEHIGQSFKALRLRQGRSLIQERTYTGLKAARARGRIGGRPKVMDAKKIVRAKELYDQNLLTPAEIAKTVGVSRSTLYRALNLTRQGKPINPEEALLLL